VDAGDEPGVKPPRPDAEAGRDAQDDGLDAGEAGSDGGCPHPWPGWITYPGVSQPCSGVYVAGDASVVPTLSWVACKTGRAACLEMSTPWPPGGAGDGWFGRVQVGTDMSQQPKRVTLTVFYGYGGAAEFVYDLGSSQALAGWGYNGQTTVNLTAASSNAELQLLPSTDVETLGGGTLEQLRSGEHLGVVPASVLPPGTGLQYDQISDTTYAFGVALVGSVVRTSIGTMDYVVARVPKLNLSMPVVRGDDVFAYVLVGSEAWPQYYRVDPDGGVSLFLSNSQHYLSGLAADGQNLYWMDSYGNTTMYVDQPNNNLWYAPYSADPTSVAATAHVLAVIPAQGAQAVAFNGYWAGLAGPIGAGYIWVVRGSDGAYARIAPEPGRQFASVGYVDANEVWAIENLERDAGGPTAGVSLERIGYSFGTEQ
jgi:hypothetical protein